MPVPMKTYFMTSTRYGAYHLRMLLNHLSDDEEDSPRVIVSQLGRDPGGAFFKIVRSDVGHSVGPLKVEAEEQSSGPGLIDDCAHC